MVSPHVLLEWPNEIGKYSWGFVFPEHLDSILFSVRVICNHRNRMLCAVAR